MGRNTITRTITSTTIRSAVVVVENGKVVTKENPSVTVNGTVENDKALKVVQSKYGKDNQYVILGVEPQEATYEISVEDFIAHATKVETPASTEGAAQA